MRRRTRDVEFCENAGWRSHQRMVQMRRSIYARADGTVRLLVPRPDVCGESRKKQVERGLGAVVQLHPRAPISKHLKRPNRISANNQVTGAKPRSV